MSGESAKHLLFFDENCPFCQNTINQIRALDRKGIFQCAPIGTLPDSFADLKQANTLILIENAHSPKKRIWMRGRGVLRIFWLLGGKWKFLGALSCVPFLPDLVYRFVAKHRHLLG